MAILGTDSPTRPSIQSRPPDSVLIGYVFSVARKSGPLGKGFRWHQHAEAFALGGAHADVVMCWLGV